MPEIEAAADAQKHRTTIYLDSDDLASLDELKAYFRRHHGRRIDRSQAIREAVRYFHQQLVTPAWRVGEGERR